LALTLHELATNATKYGAFSTANGRLHIDVGFDEGMVEITWTEVGASSLEPPQHTGFGTRLIDLSIERQLGGKINRTWGMGGLIAKISIPLIAIRDVKALMPEVTPG
jgi:two-component sensor histidine kinase